MAEKRPHVPLDQRRTELTRTAVKVMAREGAWTLTTRAVAKEAGVPHGTVHYVFSSKHELLASVMQLDLSHLSEFAETVRGFDVSDADSVRAAVTQIFASYADAVIADPDTETAYFELSLMSARDPQLREISARTHAEYRGVIGGMLEDLATRAGLRWDADMTVLAEQCVSVLFGAAVNWLEHRHDALFRAVLDDAAAALARRLR